MVAMLIGQEKENWALRLARVLGGEKIGALSERQALHLNKSLSRLIYSKPMEEITDMEVLGLYEIIVKHTSPKAYEILRKL